MFILHNRTKTFVTVKPEKGKEFTLSAGASSEPLAAEELSASISAQKRCDILDIIKVEDKPDKSRVKIEKVVPPDSGGGEGK